MKFISYYEKSEGSSFVKKEVLHSLIRLIIECKREWQARMEVKLAKREEEVRRRREEIDALFDD